MTIPPPQEFNELACTRLLTSYQWPQLWSLVSEFKPEANAKTNAGLAIKAMLLAGWWKEEELARQCIAPYKGIITDPLTHFALSYAALCLEEGSRYLNLKKQAPRTQAPWMKDWLELENYGRGNKGKEQIKHVKRITTKGKTPPIWLSAALLQSTASAAVDIKPLREWLLLLPAAVREDDLIRALQARCEMPEAWLRNGEPEDVENLPPVLLHRYALDKLTKQHQLIEAVHAFDRLAQLKYVDLYSVSTWLSVAGSIPQAWSGMAKRARYAIGLVPPSLAIRGNIATYALIMAWVGGETERAEALINSFVDFLKLPSTDAIKNPQVFFAYVGKLCILRKANPRRYFFPQIEKEATTLVAIGESHSLCLANLCIDWQGQKSRAISALVMGVKMHHMAEPSSSHHSECVRLHLENIKTKPIHLLLTIGEIDTRPNEGLWQVHRKKQQPLDELINKTVTGYIAFLQQYLEGHKLHSITLQGIPAPAYAFEGDKDPVDTVGFLAMIRDVNNCLKEKALAAGFSFLDVYSATLGEDGRSNQLWHLDDYHLKPTFYKEAQNWLQRPE